MNPDTVVFWATTGLSVALWVFVWPGSEQQGLLEPDYQRISARIARMTLVFWRGIRLAGLPL